MYFTKYQEAQLPPPVYAYDVYNINYLTQFVYTVILHFLLILTFMIYYSREHEKWALAEILKTKTTKFEL